MDASGTDISDSSTKRLRWRSILKAIGVPFLLLLLLYGSGPRVEVNDTLDRLTTTERELIQADVEQYLIRSESQPLLNPQAKIDPDLKKQIVWTGERNGKSRYSLVYLHGFSASCPDLAPVPDMLAQELNANIYHARLSAHGYADKDLASNAFENVTVNDWLNDVDEAMEIGRALGDKVILIGMSTGGTLALWKANRDAEDLAAVVLLSPNFGVASVFAPLLRGPWGKTIAHWNYGDERVMPNLEQKTPRFLKCWTTRYHPHALCELSALVSFCAAEDYRQFDLPCLCVYSSNDRLLDIPHLKTFFETRVGSSGTSQSMHDFGGEIGHGLAGDILSECAGLTPEENPNQALVAIIKEFLEQHVDDL